MFRRKLVPPASVWFSFVVESKHYARPKRQNKPNTLHDVKSQVATVTWTTGTALKAELNAHEWSCSILRPQIPNIWTHTVKCDCISCGLYDLYLALLSNVVLNKKIHNSHLSHACNTQDTVQFYIFFWTHCRFTKKMAKFHVLTVYVTPYKLVGMYQSWRVCCLHLPKVIFFSYNKSQWDALFLTFIW